MKTCVTSALPAACRLRQRSVEIYNYPSRLRPKMIDILDAGTMPTYRLGDEIDDYCVKCRRLTNHAIVSLLGEQAAKVRCKSCYGDHDYRHEQIPPSKKDLKKAALFNEVLAGVAMPPEAVVEADSTAAVDPAGPPEIS